MRIVGVCFAQFSTCWVLVDVVDFGFCYCLAEKVKRIEAVVPQLVLLACDF